MSNILNIPEKCDVVIIGGGPAGMSAALWCSDLGISSLIVDAGEQLGGQMLFTYNSIPNYLGQKAIGSRDLAVKFSESLADRSVSVATGTTVDSIDIEERLIQTSTGETVEFRYLVLAMGLRRRTLGLDGEQRLIGNGILRSGVGEAESVRGKRVIIVGGGDSAIENAITLSAIADQVTVVMRASKPSARREFRERLSTIGNLNVLTGTEVVSILGDNELEAVEVRKNTNGSRSVLPADRLLIRIGYRPNTELVRNIVELDEKEYILCGSDHVTSAERVFAIGDIVSGSFPTIQTAAGTAATAIKSISQHLNPK